MSVNIDNIGPKVSASIFLCNSHENSQNGYCLLLISISLHLSNLDQFRIQDNIIFKKNYSGHLVEFASIK
jgi:hypothetical protein